MTSDFKIIMSSDINYDDLCAEIYYRDQFFGMLTQEEGFENLKIEIHSSENNSVWTFKYEDFEKVLIAAKESLWEMRKQEDS